MFSSRVMQYGFRSVTLALALAAFAAACEDDESAGNGGGASDIADTAADTPVEEGSGTGDSGNNEPACTPEMSSGECCLAECLAANPDGRVLVEDWNGCMESACTEFDPDSEEGAVCFMESFAPSVADGACRSQTADCFSGTVAGCAELMDVAAEACEPEDLPMVGFALDDAIFCVIAQGWRGTVEAQALAWPLFACTFPLDGEGGCLEECRDGAEACRTCAAERCATQYDACEAHTRPLDEQEPTAERAACQQAFTCSLMCDTE